MIFWWHIVSNRHHGKDFDGLEKSTAILFACHNHLLSFIFGWKRSTKKKKKTTLDIVASYSSIMQFGSIRLLFWALDQDGQHKNEIENDYLETLHNQVYFLSYHVTIKLLCVIFQGNSV